MNFRDQRILIYGLGTLFVFSWAIFGVLSYFVAMIMTSGTLAIALILEAGEAQIHHRDKEYYTKMIIAMVIVVLCITLIIFKYT